MDTLSILALARLPIPTMDGDIYERIIGAHIGYKMRLTFTGFSKEEAKALRHCYAKHKWLLPDWCAQLRFKSRPTGDGSANGTYTTAEITGDDSYRYATVHVFPMWIKQSKDEQSRDIIHEFVHVALMPMVTYGDDLVESFCGEGREAEHINKTRTRFLEGTVEDLTNAIARRVR